MNKITIIESGGVFNLVTNASGIASMLLINCNMRDHWTLCFILI